MKRDYFRDRLFDLLNDSEGMGIADLNTDERNSLLTVRTEDGDVFEIVCRQAAAKFPLCLKITGMKATTIG